MGHNYECPRCGEERCICKNATSEGLITEGTPAPVVVRTEQSEFRQLRAPYDPMGYMMNLEAVAVAGVRLIERKTETYGDSWKRRGGAGAWFTTVRPWDRLETIVKNADGDVLRAVMSDMSGQDGSALACVRDVRNYLTLIEAEAVSISLSRGEEVQLANGSCIIRRTPPLQDAPVSSQPQPLPPGSSERRTALEGLPRVLHAALQQAGLGDARVVQLPGERGMGSAVVFEITVDVR